MKLLAIFIVTLTLLTGCARLNSIYRTPDFKDGESTLVDVKQRAIISSVNPHYPTQNKAEQKYIICAEPSPDALSAYASEIALSASVPEKVKAEFATAFQESAAFVGLRTQSIQLLRDTQYRLCESYRNGAIDEAEYGILSRRFQKYMVALLAIEQLTGTVKAPPVTIATESAAAASTAISSILEQMDAIDERILSKEAKKVANNASIEEKKGKKEGASAEVQKTLDKEIKLLEDENSLLDKSIENHTASKATLSENLKNLKATSVSGKGTVEVGNLTTYDFDAGSVASVADNIENITTSILDTDDFIQLCFAHMRSNKNLNPKLVSACEDRLEEVNKFQKETARLLGRLIDKGEFDLAVKLVNEYPQQTLLKASGAGFNP